MTSPWPWLQKNGTLVCLDPSSMQQSGGAGGAVAANVTEQTLVSIVAHLTRQPQEYKKFHHECSIGDSNEEGAAGDATTPCLSRVTEVYLSLDILDSENKELDLKPKMQQQQHQQHLLLIWTQLWQCLEQCLPNLETLRLYSSRHCGSNDDANSNNNSNHSRCNGSTTTIVMMNLAHWLAHFLQHSPPKWHTLIVTRCIALHPTLVATLSTALMHHKTLQQVKLLDVTAAVSMDRTRTPATTVCTTTVPLLDPLLAALSTIATLESLDLTLFHKTNDTTNQRRLSHHSHLRHSTVTTNTGTTAAATTVLVHPAQRPSLATSSTLGRSQSQCDFMSPRALHNLLVQCRRLDDVSVWDCALRTAHLDAIGRALLSARCAVRFLSLRRNPSIAAAAWTSFYTKVVPDNYTLQALYHDCVDDLSMALWCTTTTTTTTTRSAAAPMLASCAATSTVAAAAAAPILVAPPPPDANGSCSAAAASAALYLCLNRLGRGALLRNNNNHADWCDLLATVSYTPSAIFALLSHRPMLLVEAAAAATTNVE
jgi:hypothetical protein